MNTRKPLAPKSAQRRLENLLEKGFERAVEKHEAASAAQDKKIQRAKYNAGAAKSPTPPPRQSISRDKQAIDLFKIIELECYDRQGCISVDWLAEKFLFEQCQLRGDQLAYPTRTNEALLKECNHFLSRGDVGGARAAERRLKRRLRFLSGEQKEVKIYGWDKCTYLLKSCFTSWAMPPQLVVPFTVNLSKQAVQGALNAKAGFASHLQSRLHNILKRHFAGTAPDFWFVVEQGTAGGYHLHGAIACGQGANSRHQTKQALQSFSGLQNRKTVYLGRSGQRLNWAAYCLKHSLRTRKTLKGGSLFAASSSARKQGQEMYKAFHEEVRHLRRRK